MAQISNIKSPVSNPIKGGEFLIRETEASAMFIPEEFDEEQRMIAQTCREFLEREVFPRLEEIDRQQEGLMESLMDKAGELGLLGVTVPEAYGGFGKRFNTSMLVGEALGAGHSFTVAFAAHTGIGTLPILYYGTEEQKQQYVPKLVSGEWKASYCLTEPGAGSDANAGKTRAVLSEDGNKYLLNGQKMWITNGGFADIFIVFAKVDDDKDLSAFIVEKAFGGITMNPEEHKMGIKGSSTRQVFFNDCPVPMENLLSQRGKGFKIAVNILNTGRAKLCAAALGASKEVISKSVKYAGEREQFGLPVSKFGAIRYKLAEMCLRTFAVESAMYRTGKHIEDAFDAFVQNGMPENEARLKSTEEFAVECAILKVYGSESLDYVVDEGVQIFGGMGFSAEGPMDRAYRDSRINRIFEGTNEINRLLMVDMILKRALKGELDLMGPAKAVAGELMSIPDLSSGEGEGPLAPEKKLLANMKKATLLVAGSAVQKLAQILGKEQEIVMNIADMAGFTYVAESALLRAEKLHAPKLKSEEDTSLYVDMARVYLYEAVDKLWLAGKEALNSFATGDELRVMQMGLKRFTKTDAFNAKEARQRIAKKLIREDRYCF